MSAYFMYSSMCISYRSTAITAASRPAVEPGVTVKLQGQGFCGRVLDDQWSSITVSWWKKQLIVAYCPFLSSRLHLRIEFTVNLMLYHNATRTLPSPPDNEVKYLPARLHFYSALYTLCSLFIHTGRALPVCCQITFDIPKCSLILLFGLSLSASWCSCTHWFRPITCRVIVWITIVKLFGRNNTTYLCFSMSVAYPYFWNWSSHRSFILSSCSVWKLKEIVEIVKLLLNTVGTLLSLPWK